MTTTIFGIIHCLSLNIIFLISGSNCWKVISALRSRVFLQMIFSLSSLRMTPPKLMSSPNLIIVHVVDSNRLLVTFVDLGNVDIAEVHQVSLGQEDLVVQDEFDLASLAEFLLGDLLELLFAFAQ
jgi:hypothetical protein